MSEWKDARKQRPLKEGFYLVFGRWKIPGAEHEYIYRYWDGSKWKLPKILQGIEFVVKKWGEVDFSKIEFIYLEDCYLIPEEQYGELLKIVPIGKKHERELKKENDGT